MICNEQTQTRRKTPESLGEDEIEECRLNNGACPRPVYLGGTLPFQPSDTMRILPYVPHPGQTDKDRSIAPLLVAGSIE